MPMHERLPIRHDPVPLRAVLVASVDLVAAWSERLAPSAGVLAFTEADLPRALRVVTTRRPPLVLIEQMVAATSRGRTFLDCLANHPDLGGVEVQVLSAERIAAAATPGSLLACMPAVGTPLVPSERAPVRRAVRVKASETLKASVDGNPVELVDLSTMGAQVLSPGVLRPNQRVRVLLVDEQTDTAVRASADIAWSSFERPPGRRSPCFRAGMAFSSADPALEALYARLHQSRSRGSADE